MQLIAAASSESEGSSGGACESVDKALVRRLCMRPEMERRRERCSSRSEIASSSCSSCSSALGAHDESRVKALGVSDSCRGGIHRRKEGSWARERCVCDVLGPGGEG